MRVALIGAQSTGKTTVLEDLKKRILNAKYFNETTRTVMRNNLPINELGTEETQNAILDLHINNIERSKTGINIMDRCIIDWFVYTTYLYNHNPSKFSKSYLEFAKNMFLKYVKQYDIIFYLSPLGNIENDSVRSTDSNFQNEIVDIFEDIIKTYNIDVIRLDNDRNNRVKTIDNLLQQY